MSDHVNDGEDGSGYEVRWFITGERNWTDRGEIRRILTELRDDVERYGGRELVIVHGACRTGADKIADDICKELGIKTDSYPVDHKVDGPWPGAGPRRNRRAINSGPLTGWVAFWSGKRDKSGTLDAFAYASSLGIYGQVVAKKR